VENPPHLGLRPGRRARRAAVILAAWVAALGVPLVAPAEDPAAEIAEAIRSLGPPGVLWGRLAVEEESPVGPWTPLGGVDVTLYPATPAVEAELERIRQSARASGEQYETAVARVLGALSAHQGRVDAQSAGTPLAPPSPAPSDPPATGSPAAHPPPGSAPPPPASAPSPGQGGTWLSQLGEAFRPGRRIRNPATSPGAGGPGAGPGSTAAPGTAQPRHPFRQATDPSGLFAFETVPAGDWLVVAVRVAPYTGERLRAESPRPARPRSVTRRQYFLPRGVAPAKEAELWVTRVRVAPGGRVALELTDRARWMVGPVR
jgi:hypothetical protein